MGIGNDVGMLFEITNRIDNEDIPGLRKEIVVIIEKINLSDKAIARMMGMIERLADRLQKLESAAGSRPSVDIG